MRILDDTGKFSSYDYYEYFDYFRPYGEDAHHFIFDLKIEENNSHINYKKPPGTSVME
jgi:hypothetical protein